MLKTDNEAITLLLLPARIPPVLLPCRDGKAEGRIFFSKRDAHGHKYVESYAVVTKPRLTTGDLKQFPEEFRCRLKYVKALDRAAQGRDKKMVKALLADGIKRGFHTWETMDDPARLFGATLNTGLHRIMFVIWWSNTLMKLLPGLYCPSPQTAAYALALSQLGGLGALGICPKCGKLFLRSKADHTYDSSRCRAAAGMRRYRAQPKKRKS